MRELKLKPRIQIWVCINERSSHELPSCQRGRGEAVIASLQTSIARLVPERDRGDIWINRTLCQGSCSAHGVSIVLEPSSGQHTGARQVPMCRRFAAVEPHDSDEIVRAVHMMMSSGTPD